MAIDITIYLLRYGLSTIADALSRPDEWTRVPAVHQSHSSLVGYFRQSSSKVAEWATWLRAAFQFDRALPRTRSAGFIAGLEVDQRLFALTFGTGWRGLNNAVIEHDFGLVVALNQIDPEQLRSLVTRTIDIQTRQRSTDTNVGSNLHAFDLDMDIEWLRSASGRAKRCDCKLLMGADSLQLRGYSEDIGGLDQLCHELLTLYNQGIPALKSPDWEPILSSYGFGISNDTPGMASDLRSLAEPAQTMDGLEIREVTDDESLRTWAHVFTTGYGLPPALEPSVHDLGRKLGLDLPIRNFLGHWMGEPVATSSLFFGAGVVGIYNVSTLPHARGHGIGAALTFRPLYLAREMGYRIGTLQSSEMGFNVYKKLGFRHLCQIEYFQLWGCW